MTTVVAGPKIPEPLRRLARQARRNGWEIVYTGSGHLAWRAPDGTVVGTASTPNGGRRGVDNARRALAKAGLSGGGRPAPLAVARSGADAADVDPSRARRRARP